MDQLKNPKGFTLVEFMVALFILKVAYDVLQRSFGGLIDVRLSPDEENIIKSAIMDIEHTDKFVGFHELRTRKAGSQRYIDLHLVMPKDVTVEEAHRMCDHLEHDIGSRLRHISVTIHIEPCSDECLRCTVICNRRH